MMYIVAWKGHRETGQWKKPYLRCFLPPFLATGDGTAPCSHLWSNHFPSAMSSSYTVRGQWESQILPKHTTALQRPHISPPATFHPHK